MKETTKALRIILIALMLILAIIIIKYRPAYQVNLAGQTLGYVTNKEKLEIKIKDFLNDTTGNVAFREQESTPEYELKLVSRSKEIEDKTVLLAVENSCKTTYKTYAVTVDGAPQTTVESEEEAKTIIDEMKSGVDENVGLNVAIVEQYTTDYKVQSRDEASGILNTIKIAKVDAYNAEQEAKRKAEEEAAKKAVISQKTVTSVGTIAGISLSKPVSGGMITSRFGAVSRIRSSNHTGLDIGISAGTPISPIASGTVTFASYKGSYGNLIIVSHGNGIESYYAHCSAIYCSVGQTVDTSTTIGAVGSTGNSTGAHLHLEIRQNGTPLNPENYLY